MSTIERLAELAKGATPGEWKAFNMVYENGEPMTPEQLGDYVKNAVLVNPSNKDYLFISCTKADGDYDLCHIGNGPDGPNNAALIAACNPAAIAQAHAEYQELERRNAELVRALQRMVDNAIASCDGEDDGTYSVSMTEQEWGDHCAATDAACLALAPSAQEKAE